MESNEEAMRKFLEETFYIEETAMDRDPDPDNLQGDDWSLEELADREDDVIDFLGI